MRGLSLPALRSGVCALSVGGSLAVAAGAQCSLQVAETGPIPGAYRAFVAHDWDADGPGPAPARLVVGGSLRQIADAPATGIAIFDDATGSWSQLGTGLDGEVYQLATLPNGDLLASGSFQVAGSGPFSLARFDGTGWTTFGGAVSAQITTVLVRANGRVVVSGTFDTIGGVSATNVAEWDGVQWSAFGSGISGWASALAEQPNGDLVAGGSFLFAGGVFVTNVARWDGSQWSPMGSGHPNARAEAFGRLPNGDLIAFGNFQWPFGTVPAASVVARWDGVQWSPFAGALTGGVQDGLVAANGDIVVVGSRVSRWNGTAWSTIGVADDVQWGLIERAGGELVVVGRFEQLDGRSAMSVARRVGGAWLPYGVGLNGSVFAVTDLADGDVLVGGDFVGVGALGGDRIVRWDGQQFQAIGNGADASVRALTTLPNGVVVAGGDFGQIGTIAASYVASWDGTNWFAMANGAEGPVRKLVPLPNGEVLALGVWGPARGDLARWNGSQWVPLGGPVSGVRDVIRLASGDVLAVGEAMTANGAPVGAAAVWNGLTWSPIAAGLPNLFLTVAELPSGLVVAGGIGTAAPGALNAVMQWDGAVWTPMPGGVTSSTQVPIVELVRAVPGGGLLLSGRVDTVGGQPTQRLAQWNGATWQPVPFDLGVVRAIHQTPRGDVLIGTLYPQAQAAARTAMLRLSSTCPADAVSFGSGCSSSAGLLELTATWLPFEGGVYRSRTTGIPAQSIVVSAFGFGALSVPMPSVLPEGLPGCSFLVTPDLVDFLPATGSVATTELVIAPVPSLLGVPVYQQVLAAEVFPAGGFALGGSNGLTLTIGRF